MAGAFLTEVDRLPWKSQSVMRATHKVKSLRFVCSSIFSLSLRRVSPFSRGVILHARRLARSTIPEGKWGLLVV